MFFLNLKNAMPTFTRSEHKIAFYLSNNFQNAKTLTSYELAEKINVGQSTIVRFSQKLGYKTFNDMQEDLMNAEEEQKDFSSVNVDEETYQTNEKIYRNHVENIKEILQYNSNETFDIIAEHIARAKKIFCCGAQSSLCIAKILSNRLAEYGIQTFCDVDSFESYAYINNMEKGDVAIFISASGESVCVLDVLKLAKQKEVTIISITGMQDNSMKKLSDYHLVCSESVIYTNTRALVNNCSQLFLVDCICMNVWKKNPDVYSKNLATFDEYIRPVFGGLVKKEYYE